MTAAHTPSPRQYDSEPADQVKSIYDDRAAYALMVLNLADIVQVSDEHIWVSITREDWEALYPPPPMLSELTLTTQPEVTP